MTNSVTIIQGRPTRQRIVILVAISCHAYERLVVILLTIRQFFSSTVILLTLFVSLSIFGRGTFLIFYPVIAIVDIRVSLVRARFEWRRKVSYRLMRIVRRDRHAIVGRMRRVRVV